MGIKAALTAIFAATLLAACAGGSIDYMVKEYGYVSSDGSVDIGDQPSYPQIYKIWVHKTKPKILVQTDVATASSVGMARGLTLGVADAAPIQPTFQQAGLKYLNENKSPDCRLSNAVKVHDVAWEFDYDCSAPQPAGQPKKRLRTT